MGVSSAALTHQRRRQKDRWFEAGWASKSLTERKYGKKKPPLSDHLKFPLLHPKLETVNVQMNESFLGEKLSQRFLSSVELLCWEV